MFGHLAVFVQHLQTTKTTDTVRQVHDQIAFTQIQETIDRFAEPFFARPPKFGSMEHLIAANNHLSLVTNPKPSVHTTHTKVQMPLRRSRRRRQNLSHPWQLTFDFRQHIQFLFFAGVAVQTIHLQLQITDIATELFDRINRKLPASAHEARCHLAGRSQSKPRPLLIQTAPRIKSLTFGTAFEIAVAMFQQTLRLMQ